MGWIIDPIIDDNFNISYNNTLAGSSYIKLSKKLDHRKKSFINNQNTDNNECFKWFLVGYLHPAKVFESILMPEDNGKQNPKKSYTNKHQLPITCSYGYKFACVDGAFSKPLKLY